MRQTRRGFLGAYGGGALAALLLTGCGGSDDLLLPGDTRVTPSAGRFGDLVFTLTTADERAVFERSETIPLRFTVRNTGTTAVDYTIGPPERDLRAERDGQTVWQDSFGKAFPAVLYNRSLAPGETLTYEVSWNQRNNDETQVASGIYTINAWLLAGLPGSPPPRPETDLDSGPITITIR